MIRAPAIVVFITGLMIGCNSTVVPTPVPPAPTPTPGPIEPVHTQADVFAAVGRWLADEASEAPRWVVTELESGGMGTDLPVTGFPQFGPVMTAESQLALADALGEVTFVDATDGLVDPNGPDIMFGCRAYFDDGRALHLTAPHASPVTNDFYLVGVEVEYGCGGQLQVVKVTRDSAGVLSVTEVISNGEWIV